MLRIMYREIVIYEALRNHRFENIFCSLSLWFPLDVNVCLAAVNAQVFVSWNVDTHMQGMITTALEHS